MTEVTARLRAMSTADKLRFIRDLSYSSFGDARSLADLRQEAMRRTLDGTRKCPRNVPIVTFLRGAMRSIAWADRKASACRPKLARAQFGCSRRRRSRNPRSPHERGRSGLGAKSDSRNTRTYPWFVQRRRRGPPIGPGYDGRHPGTELRELLELSATEFASKRRPRTAPN